MSTDIHLADRKRLVTNGFQGGFPVALLPFVTYCGERTHYGGVWPYNSIAITDAHSTVEGRERIERVRETSGEFWTVGDDDRDSLGSAQILEKTGIRLGERAEEDTVLE